MWETIVLNLLSNAFKIHFLEGEIAVTLQEREGDAAVLTIRDTGTGIPSEELPRLFDRFHRVEGAKGRSFEGSGIGLALVKELVAQHGGKIAVESEVGVGTSFAVTLPLGCEHLAAEQIDPSEDISSATSKAESFVQEALRWIARIDPPRGDARRRENFSAPTAMAPSRDGNGSSWLTTTPTCAPTSSVCWKSKAMRCKRSAAASRPSRRSAITSPTCWSPT